MSILNSIAPTVSTSAGECESENKEQQLLEEMAKELRRRPTADSTLIPATVMDTRDARGPDRGVYHSDPEISPYQDLTVSAPAYLTSFNPRQHPASDCIGLDEEYVDTLGHPVDLLLLPDPHNL